MFKTLFPWKLGHRLCTGLTISSEKYDKDACTLNFVHDSSRSQNKIECLLDLVSEAPRMRQPVMHMALPKRCGQ